MMTWSSTYSQNYQLQLVDTVSEEGSLRYFKLRSDIAKKGISESASILKVALKADTDTEFRLVKTKKGQNLEKHLLYQQYYKAVPVYDGYYYLHFKNEIFTYANGEYTSINRASNTIKFSKATSVEIAISNTSTRKLSQPSSTEAELILWRQNRQEEYKYIYKV